jgi:dTDP-4-dehydrorhamnose reductase
MVEEIEKKRRTVLVTGANGMFGRDLCAELSNTYDVTGLDVTGQATAHFVQCDIREKESVVRVIEKRDPDLVIHAAAWTDVDGCEADPEKARSVNEQGTKNVSIAAKRCGAPVVFISTDFIFDGTKGTAYTEKDQPHPLGVYARSKDAGERTITELDSYIIIRTGWLYGTHGKNFVDTILAIAKREKQLKVVSDQVGSPTYTKDLARALSRLLEVLQPFRNSGKREPQTAHRTPLKEIYHISNKGAVSWFDYTKTILELARMEREVLPITSSELGRLAKRPAFSVLDNTKFEKAAGFVMRKWQDALREYIYEQKEK